MNDQKLIDKKDKDSQEYTEFLNELREEMSAKGLTSEDLDEILSDVQAYGSNRYKLFHIVRGEVFDAFRSPTLKGRVLQ